ncbi:hypothetical protein D9M68_874000 [compost metagenome]
MVCGDWCASDDCFDWVNSLGGDTRNDKIEEERGVRSRRCCSVDFFNGNTDFGTGRRGICYAIYGDLAGCVDWVVIGSLVKISRC